MESFDYSWIIEIEDQDHIINYRYIARKQGEGRWDPRGIQALLACDCHNSLPQRDQKGDRTSICQARLFCLLNLGHSIVIIYRKLIFYTVCAQYQLIQVVNRSEAKQMKAKLDSQNPQKKRTKHSLYLTRSNCKDNVDSLLYKQKYLYTLNSFANNNLALVDVFKTFSPCLYHLPSYAQGDATLETPLNLLFMYMVELYRLHDQYLPESTKSTEFEITTLNDLLGGNFDQKFKNLPKKMEIVIKEFKNEGKSTSKMEGYNTKISEKIARVRKLKQSLKSKYASSILAIKQPEIRQIYIPKHLQPIAKEHIDKTLTTLHDLQFTKRKYRYQKLENFFLKYKGMWKVRRINSEKHREGYVKSFMTSRYTNVRDTSNYFQEEVFITLRDLLNMKKEEESWDRELGIEIMRQLGKALNEHRRITGNHYPMLHPKDIIINQMQLKVHLSHISPVLSALGLMNTPMTYEQMIAFAATPSIFDPFSAPLEHLDENIQYGTGREIFNDIAYGLDSLIKDPKTDKYYPPLKFQGNDLTMSEVKQHYEKISEAWRFTMIGSYLLNGREYHKQYENSTASYDSFKDYLRKEKDKYSKNIVQYIQKVLDFEMEVDEDDLEDEFSLSIYNKFLGILKQDSELRQAHRFYKLQRIISIKQSLSINLRNDLTGQSFFKLNNQKKYLIMFYLSLFQSLFHIKIFSEYAIQDYNLCKERLERVIKAIHKNIGINDRLDDVDKDSFIEKSTSKFKEYLEKVEKNEKKEKEIAEALKYLDRNYSRAYGGMEEQRKKYYQIKETFRKYLFCEHDLQIQELKVVFQKIISQASPLMKEYRTYLLEIVQKQLSFPREITKNEALTKPILHISSLHVKLNLFLTITRENFLTLESLVLPLISIKKKKEQAQQTPFEESFEFHLYALDILKEHQCEPAKHNAQHSQSHPNRSESEQISLQQ